jgi:hypothetical protein
MCPLEPSCPGEAHSRFKENKHGLKKPGDFTVFEGHRYPLVSYIIPTSPNEKELKIKLQLRNIFLCT